MNLDELLLNVKAVSFDSMISQKDILTKEDKEWYSQNGYHMPFTADEFKSKFDLDPGCIWYTPSVYHDSLYFNPDTLAAAPFHLDFILSGIGPGVDSMYEYIRELEGQVAEHDYMKVIMSLPDAMQMEYFNKLIEKNGSDIPGLYNLFFTFYLNSDYGFGAVKDRTLKAILDSKTEDEKVKTNAALEELPVVLRIYRGGNTASTPYDKAYSWTLDVNVATFFACRRGQNEGYIVEAEVNKEDIIEAFLDDRGEQEVIVDPSKLNIVQERPVHGVEFLEQMLPKVAPMYQKYRDQLMDLEFAQDSEEHGYSHEARVMLLSLMIGEHMNLSSRDLKVLATAALYHDLQRVNDNTDESHGSAGKEFYHSTVSSPDPLVEFLCEFHCLSDEKGYEEIRNNRKLSKNRSRAKQLYDIFKDADALDRCRFGLRALDVNQLRLPISKELPLVARLCYEQVRLPERQRPVKNESVGKDKGTLKPTLDSIISSAAPKALSQAVTNENNYDHER